MLAQFTPPRVSTVFLPGSHRWPLKFPLHPPKPQLGHQVNALAGSLFAFDGRLWHDNGGNLEGHPHRAISAFCCAHDWDSEPVVCLIITMAPGSDTKELPLAAQESRVRTL